MINAPTTSPNAPYFTAQEFFFLVKSSIFDLRQSQQMKPNYNTTTYDFEICEEVNINKSEGRETENISVFDKYKGTMCASAK